MRSRKTVVAGVFGVLLAGIMAMPVLGTPIIVRVEVGGVPQVLRVQSGMYSSGGSANASGRLGYHFAHDRIYWSDHNSSGHTYAWLDPLLMGDLSGTHDSKTGRARYWSTSGDQYAGTVSGNTKYGNSEGNLGMAYLPNEQSILVRSGNSGGWLNEIQAARSVAGADVLTEGTAADQTLAVRLRSRTSHNPATGSFQAGLCLSGEDSTNYYFLSVNRTEVIASQEFARFRLNKVYATSPTATTVGSRTFFGLSNNHVPATFVTNLVPAISDAFVDLANDTQGRIWALSASGGTNFLTAFTITLAGATTQIDLDPDDDNGYGSKYINLKDLIRSRDNITNVNAHGLTVNADATRIYIAADGGSSSASDSIFIFKRTVPELTTLPAVNVLTNTADLVGYLSAYSANVRCYWGTNDGGTVESAWMTNTVLGSATAPATLTNSVTGLEGGKQYFYRFLGSNSADVAWATNTVTFSTMGGATAVDVNNGAPVYLTPTSERLWGEVLGGVPLPNVWIYWGTTDGGTDKNAWNKPPIDKGQLSLGTFSADVSGLIANQQYWYRCYASNANEDAWAPTSTNFTTIGPTLSIMDALLSEGAQGTTNNAVFAVSLTVTSAVNVKVDYTTVDGTATTADEDYVYTTDTLTIPAGSVTAQITVPVVGNNRYEADETFTITLSNPDGLVLVDTVGLATILNDDWTWYVRCDGGGSDANDGSSWDQAFASVSNALQRVPVSVYPPPASVINVQATTGAQAYDAASRAVTGPGYDGHLNLSLEGGWTDVGGTPVQTGRSLIKDLDGLVDERGLELYSNDSHGRSKAISVNRLDFADVTDGIRLANSPNLSYTSFITLLLRNSTIAANSNGVVLSYNEYGRIPLTCTNVAIRAGLGGLAGDGVFFDYQPGPMVFDQTTISSAKGCGLYSQGICNVGWLNSYTLFMRDSAVTNCFTHGIYLGENTFGHYDTPGQVWLDRVRLTGNGGMGFFAKRDNGNYVHQNYYFSATNTVIAGNGSHGLFLDGTDTSDLSGDIPDSAAVYATLVNCTVANNGGDGVRVWCEQPGLAGGVTAYNTIFANNTGYAINMEDFTNNIPVVTEAWNDFFGNGASDIQVVGMWGTVTNNQTTAATDLMVDPVFCTKQPDPYRLGLGSPLLNAGTNAPAPAVDILLVARPDGAFVSMGAYETGIAGTGGTLIMMR